MCSDLEEDTQSGTRPSRLDFSLCAEEMKSWADHPISWGIYRRGPPTPHSPRHPHPTLEHLAMQKCTMRAMRIMHHNMPNFAHAQPHLRRNNNGPFQEVREYPKLNSEAWNCFLLPVSSSKGAGRYTGLLLWKCVHCAIQCTRFLEKSVQCTLYSVHCLVH